MNSEADVFCLSILPPFCYKVKIADVKKVWKPVTAMGRSPSVLPGAMELRTKWLVWWRLLFKGRLLSRTKVPGSSRERCFEEQNRLKMGYPSLQAPIFHFIVFTLHSKPLSYPEMQPCSSLQTCSQASVSSTFSARLGVRVRQIPQLPLGLTVSRSHLHRVSTLPLGVLLLSFISSIRRASPGVLWPDALLTHLATLLKPVLFTSHTCLPVSLTPMVITVLKTHLLHSPACREGCQA